MFRETLLFMSKVSVRSLLYLCSFRLFSKLEVSEERCSLRHQASSSLFQTKRNVLKTDLIYILAVNLETSRLYLYLSHI